MAVSACVANEDTAMAPSLEDAIAFRRYNSHSVEIPLERRNSRQVTLDQTISVSDDSGVWRVSSDQVDGFVRDLIHVSSITQVGLDLNLRAPGGSRQAKGQAVACEHQSIQIDIDPN